MQVMQVLSAFLLFSLFEIGISQNNGCCTTKSVGDFEYRLIDADGPTAGLNCIDKCVYEQFGIPGSRFCFARGDRPVLCLQKLIEQWTSESGIEIVERVKEQYKELEAETSIFAAAKLESFLNEMTEITGLLPNSTNPFLSGLEEAQKNFYGMPAANTAAINSSLIQIADNIETLMAFDSVTVQDVKEEVKLMSKVVHQKYGNGSGDSFMYNCELGLSLITLTALESMAILFMPESKGGQGAGKTLFDAMYANTDTIPPPYEEPECCDNVVRAWQGSTGALLDGLITTTREKFPDVTNFNDLQVNSFVPFTSAFKKAAVEAGERGSRIISTNIFKDLMTPTNK